MTGLACRVSVESPHRFRVEVLFSPGASHNPCSVVPIHRDHTLPVVHRHPLHRGQSSPFDPLLCDQSDLFCFQANSNSSGHHSKCSIVCVLTFVIASRAHQHRDIKSEFPQVTVFSQSMQFQHKGCSRLMPSAPKSGCFSRSLDWMGSSPSNLSASLVCHRNGYDLERC